MTQAAFRGWFKGRMSEARKTVLDNRYDVGRPLGSGGMGEVFLARDRVLGRDVALKVLRTQYAGDSEFAERFKREARSAASLSHPNIVQVYDRGDTEDGSSYIAMEYVPGGTLKERVVGEGPLGTREAAALGAQVAEALGAAHERGMVHRDIKPQNVLLTDRGDAKVADFGIARAGSSVTISRTGSVMGTAGYMSPEQALGEPATPKSDLYSLGVVLFEALTGELPYTADNPIAVSMKHVNEPVRSPREIDPTIPEGMDALVTRLMAKDPEDRYASADELADDLWRTSRGREPTAAAVAAAPTRLQQASVAASSPTRRVPPPRPSPVRRRRRRIPWFLILVAAILFFLGTLGLLRSVMGPSFANAWFDFLGQGNNPQAGPFAPQTVKVPDVAGLTTAEARQRLTGAGLKVGQINSFQNNNVAAGRVIASGVAAGTPVDRGTEINLDVSTGPPPASSPSPTATAQPSPEPANTATPTATAQPSQQEDRQTARQPRGAGNVPAAGQNNGATSASPNATAAPGVSEDKGARRGEAEDNSGPGGNSGPGSGNSED
jgi:eukaryotic-like serine/threonine-protein kinase